jgi:regulatory protein
VSNKNTDVLRKARDYAFLLLKFRLRSEKELYQRLKNKKFDEGIVRETIAFLKDKDFINDDEFARGWIESRIKKPLGLIRLKQELKLKGIANDIIDRQIKEISEGYSEEEIVSKITQDKFRKFKNIEPVKAKRRIYAYLLRRGFSPEVVLDAIGQLKIGYEG